MNARNFGPALALAAALIVAGLGRTSGAQAVGRAADRAMGDAVGIAPRIAPGATAAAGLVINEIMSSNTAVAPDEDGSFQDWIELYNGGAATVNLDQYGLTDDPALPFKWRLPNVSIAAGGHLLIYASDKNRTAPQLHTNFKISADGESIVLTKPDTTTADTFPAVSLLSNTSYGRRPDGASSFAFFSTSSPGQSNALGVSVFITPPATSLASGFYTQSQQLRLSTVISGAEIRYTLDGSEPGPTSTLYTGPINIVDRSAEPNVFSNYRTTGTQSDSNGIVAWKPPSGVVYKGTVIRARTFSSAYSSTVQSASYFVSPDALTRYPGMVVVSAIGSVADLLDPSTGLFGLGADPGTTIPYPLANFNTSAEKRVHVAVFNASRSRVLEQGAGVRINGDITRAQPMKSLRLYARSEYGTPSFAYPLFPGKPIAQYQRLLLRNAGQDFSRSMLRDVIARSYTPPTLLSQAYQPAVVFINGEFWGVHNLLERIDEYYLAANTGVDRNAVDLVEMRFTDAEIDAGDLVHWDAMIAWLETHALADPGNYAYLRTQMDVENFTDYVILNVWASNTDWPGNNVRMWRPREVGGRWQWLPYGMEVGLGFPGWSSWSIDSLAAIGTDQRSKVWWILGKLLENENYKIYFAQRAAGLLYGPLSARAARKNVESRKAEINAAMPEHIVRWGYPSTVSDWNAEFDVLREFVTLRPASLMGHIPANIGLNSQVVQVNVVISPSQSAGLVFNTLPVGMITDTWQGLYFSGVPMSATMQAQPGYAPQDWHVSTSSATLPPVLGASITLTPTTEITLTANLRFVGFSYQLPIVFR